MTNYVVSIGRNIEDTPMIETQWVAFTAEILQAIDKNDGKLFTFAKGDGEYDGLVEETAVFVFEIADNGPTYRLEKTLGHIAYKFGQECIAWQEVKTVRFIAP